MLEDEVFAEIEGFEEAAARACSAELAAVSGLPFVADDGEVRELRRTSGFVFFLTVSSSEESTFVWSGADEEVEVEEDEAALEAAARAARDAAEDASRFFRSDAGSESPLAEPGTASSRESS